MFLWSGQGLLPTGGGDVAQRQRERLASEGVPYTEHKRKPVSIIAYGIFFVIRRYFPQAAAVQQGALWARVDL